MGLEESYPEESSTLRVLEPEWSNIVPMFAERAMESLNRDPWTLEELLKKYEVPIWNFYTENGNPQTEEEKVGLLRLKHGRNGFPWISIKKERECLEYDLLIVLGFWNKRDVSSFSV